MIFDGARLVESGEFRATETGVFRITENYAVPSVDAAFTAAGKLRTAVSGAGSVTVSIPEFSASGLHGVGGTASLAIGVFSTAISARQLSGLLGPRFRPDAVDSSFETDVVPSIFEPTVSASTFKPPYTTNRRSVPADKRRFVA